MKFDEFPYKRLNINELKSKVDEIIVVFNSNSSLDTQDQSLNQMNDLLAEYESYESIAGLNFNRDTTSEKYKAEKDYYDNLSPEFKDLKDQFNSAIMKSKFLPELNNSFDRVVMNPPYFFNSKVVSSSDLVLSVSEFTRDEIINRLDRILITIFKISPSVFKL